MENVATSIDIVNDALREQYHMLCNNLRQVAKVAIGSRYTQQLIQHIQFCAPVRLSDDFPDGYTTIISQDELNSYLQGPVYNEMVRRQCVVSICAYTEAFVSSLYQIMELKESDGEGYGQFAKIFNLDMHNSNKVLRKLYYIYNHVKVQLKFRTSNLENVECPKMLDEMFTIRHVIVHFGGEVVKQVHQERIGPRYKTKSNEVVLGPNAIDEFVHRVTINLRSLVLEIDACLTNSA